MRFSVVIPVYNKADTILETVRSVLAQSCEDREIVIVDDGSSDALETMLEPVRGQIRLIRQQNAGVSAARNRGIQESRGEYVCFLDADDLWLPDHLTTLSSAIDARPETRFLSTMYRTTYPDGTMRSKLALLQKKPEQIWIENYFEFVLKYSTTFIHTDTMCIHRSILKTSALKLVSGSEKIPTCGIESRPIILCCSFRGKLRSIGVNSAQRRRRNKQFAMGVCTTGDTADARSCHIKRQAAMHTSAVGQVALYLLPSDAAQGRPCQRMAIFEGCKVSAAKALCFLCFPLCTSRADAEETH